MQYIYIIYNKILKYITCKACSALFHTILYIYIKKTNLSSSVCVCVMCVWRERERQTDRQTDRQTETDTERQRERERMNQLYEGSGSSFFLSLLFSFLFLFRVLFDFELGGISGSGHSEEQHL